MGLLFLGLEIFIVSFGLLTLGALVCFYWAFQMAQAVELASNPFRVQVLAAVVVSGLCFLSYLAYGGWKLKRRRQLAPLQRVKVIHLDSAQEGYVEWNGERWHFKSPTPVTLGDELVVDRIEGLVVFVSKSNQARS